MATTRDRPIERRMSVMVEFRPRNNASRLSFSPDDHQRFCVPMRQRSKSSGGLEAAMAEHEPWYGVFESSFPKFEADPPNSPVFARGPPQFQYQSMHNRASLGSVSNSVRSIARRASMNLKSALPVFGSKVRRASEAAGGSVEPSSQWQQVAEAMPWRKTGFFRRSRPTSANLCANVLSISPPSSFACSSPSLLPFAPTPGAAARAAAAAQNEKSSTFGVSNSSDLKMPARPYRLQRDSESGISLSCSHQRIDSVHDFGARAVRKDPMTYLPHELISQIFIYLDSHSVREAEQVSRAWNVTASSQPVWREIFLREFSPAPPISSYPLANGGKGIGKSSSAQQPWKTMCKARISLDERWSKGDAVAMYLDGHTDGVYCVQYDEDKIITGSRDRTVRVWDMHTFRCIKVIGIPTARDNDIRHFSTPDRALLTVHPSTPQPLDRRQILPESVYHSPAYYHDASILCLQYDDEIMVTGSSDRTLIVWDIVTFEPLQRLEGHTAGVLDIAFDKYKIVSCSKDTTICIWSRSTGELLQQLSGHKGPVNAVQLRGDLAVSASGDGVAKLWNLNPPGHAKCVKEFRSQDRGLACVEFSEDGKYLVAGGNDQIIYKFCTQTGDLVASMAGHTNLVRSLYLDGANGRLVSGSYDMSLKVWDFATGDRIGNFANWTTSWMLSAKSDYRRIVSTSQDGRALVMDFGWGLDGVELLKG